MYIRNITQHNKNIEKFNKQSRLNKCCCYIYFYGYRFLISQLNNMREALWIRAIYPKYALLYSVYSSRFQRLMYQE